MRLKSFYASQIDYLKNECVKILAKNAEKALSTAEFDIFVDNLISLIGVLTNKQIEFYFSKK